MVINQQQTTPNLNTCQVFAVKRPWAKVVTFARNRRAEKKTRAPFLGHLQRLHLELVKAHFVGAQPTFNAH